MRGERERDLLRGAEEGLRRGRVAAAIQAYSALLDLYASRGADAKSAAVLATLVKIEPKEARWPELLAELHTRMRHYREASEWWARVARIHADAGRHEDAERAWRRAHDDPTGLHTPLTGPHDALRADALPIAKGRPLEAPPPVAPSVARADTDPGFIEPGHTGAHAGPTAPEVEAMDRPPLDLDGPEPFDLGSFSGYEEPPLPEENARTDAHSALHQATLALGPDELASGDDSDARTIAVSAAAVRAAVALSRRLEPEEATEEHELGDEPDALEGDKTLWDPGFLNNHSPPKIGRGLSLRPGKAPNDPEEG